MSPAERLAAAHQAWMDDFTMPNRFVDGMFVADPHLAQDIADGEALRRLREVMADDDGLGLFITRWGVVQASVAVIPAAQHGKGDPVSQAADACREAIEAQRPEASR